MSAHNGTLPVVDVDQAFPLLTTESTTRSGGQPGVSTGDQTQTVTAVLRDVLGWRPRVQDTAAFTAALDGAFELSEVEGHVEARYLARGFAMQADLGAVSGGQASLYARARSAHTQIGELLDGLVALRPDADPEDCAAFRSLVRHEIGLLVDELGMPGGPRQPIVDSAFDVLAGATGSTPVPVAGAVVPRATADDITGQLGALRDRFGLTDANVNTIEEERVRTSFWTLVDLVLDLRRSWDEQKGALSGSGSGFLGTDLVLISRLLAAAAEQVDEVESVLDSVMISRSERETLRLSEDSGVTLDGLLSWLRRFLAEDGPTYVRESGRDGIRTAFAPLLQTLLSTVRGELIDPVGDIDGHAGSRTTTSKDGARTRASGSFPHRMIPTSATAALPSGMFAARTRIAVAGLGRLLRDLFVTAAQISRYPGVVLFDVHLQEVTGVEEELTSNEALVTYVRVSVRGANLRSTYVPVLVQPGTGRQRLHLAPLSGSASADDDEITAVFRVDTTVFPDLTALLDEHPDGVVVPAQALPVAVRDLENGAEITAPPTVVWPTLAPVAANPGRAPVDWSQVPEDEAGDVPEDDDAEDDADGPGPEAGRGPTGGWLRDDDPPQRTGPEEQDAGLATTAFARAAAPLRASHERAVLASARFDEALQVARRAVDEAEQRVARMRDGSKNAGSAQQDLATKRQLVEAAELALRTAQDMQQQTWALAQAAGVVEVLEDQRRAADDRSHRTSEDEADHEAPRS